MNIFNEIDKFFSSLKNYLEMDQIFLFFIGLFLLTVIIVIISTSRAYESRLIKAIDMFNNYFIDNPQITEDNLVPFNAKMKSRKVPKQLRKQWQQFVLYRKKKASEYMSFDTCVTIPIKNSTYRRDISIMNSISWLLIVMSFLVDLYMVLSNEISVILRQSFLTPAIILVLNIIVTIFLDLRHNAIVSDLNQNFQYFEVNIDKATETLPEYVDYEVLFDKNEIKRGIPMLYAYLQRRAEIEKKELERARLKNVQHEKFNFDEAGIESSLVLERAMQEAESYLAERKKLMQDMEQINADITQEEMNFRETTKEYQRQMQVSKEAFDNFKEKMQEEESSIALNYLRKQQQQELDRQRNLERDYDTATDRHKKLIANYQEELTSVENEIKKARNTLERSMMSEFDTYSEKVYDSAMQTVEQREKEKTDALKNKIKELEETLVAKNNEIMAINSQKENLNSELATQVDEYKRKLDEQEQIINRVSEEVGKSKKKNTQQEKNANNKNDTNSANAESYAEQTNASNDYSTVSESNGDYTAQATNDYNTESTDNYTNENDNYNYTEQPTNTETFNYTSEPIASEDKADYQESTEMFNYYDEDETADKNEDDSQNNQFNYTNIENDENEGNGNDESTGSGYVAKEIDFGDDDFDYNEVDEIEEQDNNLNEEQVSDNHNGLVVNQLTSETNEPKRKAGRPRKIKTEQDENKIAKKRGRPRKEKIEAKEKKRVGRPRKEETEQKFDESNKTEQVENKATKKRGRPRKEQNNSTTKKVGRPKKNNAQSEQLDANTKRKVGRPKKEKAETKAKNRVGRPKKEETKSASKKVGRPKKTELEQVEKKQTKKRGRPKKSKEKDIDSYLKEIDDEIAKTNAKMVESVKALEKNATIKKHKK